MMHNVPLSAVATAPEVAGSNQISRKYIKRRVYVSANVEGRGLASVVSEIPTWERDRVDVLPG
jgi:Cu/Ag efflux pump CusA